MKRKLLSLLLSAGIMISSFSIDLPVLAAENASTEEQPQVDLNSTGGHYVNEADKACAEVDYSVYKSSESLFSATYGASASDSYYKNSKATAVRNQNPYGLCWSFAATACIEADLARNEGVSNPDYSELAMAYFCYNPSKDPLGLMSTRSYNHGAVINQGGNQSMCVSALASGMVGTKESNAKYTGIYNGLKLSTAKSYTGEIYLNNAMFISTTDKALMKAHILKYGAVAISYNANDNYLNKKTGGYYYPTETYQNHDVVIIGWDDNYAVSNFNSGSRPKKKGAWIVKNSWGTSAGKNGYIYISYEDKSLGSTGYVYDVEKGKVSDNYYQYDFNYSPNASFVLTTTIAANVFTAKANTKANGYETIDHVAFETHDANVDYEIRVYTDLQPDENGETNPGNGTLADTITGSLNTAGYYTRKLNKSIAVTEGSRFSVVVILTGRDGFSKYIAVRSTEENYGNSYAAFWSGEDIHYYSIGYAPIIKAFTKNRVGTTPRARIKLNKTSLTLAPEATASLSATLEGISLEDGYTVRWRSTDESLATVNEEGLVTGVEEQGDARIIAEVYDENEEYAGIYAACSVFVSTAPAKSLTVYNGKTALKSGSVIKLKKGQSVTLTAKVSGSQISTYRGLDRIKDCGWSESVPCFVASLTSDTISYTDTSITMKQTIVASSVGTDTITCYVGGMYSKVVIEVIDPCVINATVASATTSSVKLTWNASSASDVTGYYVAIYYPSNSVLSIVKTITSRKTTSCTISKLSSGKTYHFVILEKVGSNYYRSHYGFVTQATTRPAKVTGAKVSAVSKSAIKVTWKKVSTAHGYYIYAATSKNGKYTKVGTVSASATSFTYSKLKSKKYYYFKVYAYRTVTGKVYTGSASSIFYGKTK